MELEEHVRSISAFPFWTTMLKLALACSVHGAVACTGPSPDIGDSSFPYMSFNAAKGEPHTLMSNGHDTHEECAPYQKLYTQIYWGSNVNSSNHKRTVFGFFMGVGADNAISTVIGQPSCEGRTAWGTRIWKSSDCHGPRPYRLELQRDCNLVLYDAAGSVCWATGTEGRCSNPIILVKEGGNTVLIDDNGHEIWDNHAYPSFDTSLNTSLIV